MAKTRSFASMPQKPISVRRRKWYALGYIAIFVALASTYITLTLTQKPDKVALRQFHLTLTSYHWLIATVLVILGITWATSLYGSLVFKLYSSLIRNSNDGR